MTPLGLSGVVDMISNALILDNGAIFLMTFPQTLSVIQKWQSIFKRDHHAVAIIPLWHTISMMASWVFNGGRGEWGISRCPSNYPFKFTPFCGWKVEGGRGVQNIIKLRTSEREIHLLPVDENFPQIWHLVHLERPHINKVFSLVY